MGSSRICFVLAPLALTAVALGQESTSLNLDSTVGINNGLLVWTYAGGLTQSESLPNLTSTESTSVLVPADELDSNLTYTLFGLVSAAPTGGPPVIVGFDPTAANGIIGQKSFMQVFGVPTSMVSAALENQTPANIAQTEMLFSSHQILFGHGTTPETLGSFTGTATAANNGTIQLTPVPEPAPFIGLGFGALGILLRRRKPGTD